jgi:aspartyl-tRNA(Asn)/glutamyl-tRNA(Gln) amidotransferase subunit B
VKADDGVDPTVLANWVQALVERLEDGEDPADSKLSPAAFAALVRLVADRAVSRDAGREVLGILLAEGGEPAAIVEREGLGSLSSDDGGLTEIVAAAIAADPDAAENVRSGNMRAVGPLVGYVMRETKGRADGGEITRLIREQLGLT